VLHILPTFELKELSGRGVFLRERDLAEFAAVLAVKSRSLLYTSNVLKLC
jgi:hypothetical protein